jgi:UDP-N-acetylmuramate dehydrogenase
MEVPLTGAKAEVLRRIFGKDLREKELIARYTSARIGGPVDFLIIPRSAGQLKKTAQSLWKEEIPFRVLGGGSNILVADQGVRGVIVLNRARGVQFKETAEQLRLEAESGASLSSVAKRAVKRGWSGLEWAVNIPGTIGGAVVGNAGAHGSDISSNLEMAEILQQKEGVEQWSSDRLEYAYRDSWLKRHPGCAVVLTAVLRMEQSTPEETGAKMASIISHRKRTQPEGASMGSMFKNPPGDSAGRLIEAAGLKGMRRGSAQISPKHGNFFINLGGAVASDVLELIRISREKVFEKFGIELELEVELLGDWGGAKASAIQSLEGGEV